MMTDWFRVQIVALIVGLYIIVGLCACIKGRQNALGLTDRQAGISTRESVFNLDLAPAKHGKRHE